MRKPCSAGFARGGLIAMLALGLLAGAAAQIEPQQVTIDAAKTGEPMSKYIYGQFTEHLGRCIYGGIWAQMLEDRKFYYPVTDKFEPWRLNEGDKDWGSPPFPVMVSSPWRVVGPAGTVRMITDKGQVFVGEHTPQVNGSDKDTVRGIEQPGLGLVKGKDYVGYVWISGDPGADPIVVTLSWGKGEEQNKTVVIEKVTREYAKTEFKFKSGATTDDGKLAITSTGGGAFRIGTVSLMPADNVQGFRADTLKLLKELDSPVYRWPGGNFVSGYNWRDGIGDRDRRPPRKNPAWTGIEHDDVGIHEFMVLCKLINTEPYIAVNTGLGTVEQAGEEVQYVNGAADTPLGKLRAQNGHPEPYGVKFWSAGNEMFGDWQLGNIPLDQYVKKHNSVVDVMRKADPSIKIVAVGNVGRWDQTMLAQSADYMNLISEHFYMKTKSDVAEHVAQLKNEIKRIAAAHRDYRKTIPGLAGKDIKIAMDEWNYWFGPYLYGQLGVQYFLKDALGVAEGLNEYSRNTDIIYMANYAQTVNVIGAIKTSKTAATLDSTGVVLALYRKQFGTIPVPASGFTAPYDVAAMWTEGKKALTVSIVNPTKAAAEFKLDVTGAKLAARGRSFTVSGTDEKACNVPGKAPQVKVKEAAAAMRNGIVKVGPLSATIFRFETK